MPQTEPQFKPGDRFWTHYDYKWGTVVKLSHTVRDATHGVTGSKLPDTTWYDVCYDDNAPKIGAPWCTCDNGVTDEDCPIHGKLECRDWSRWPVSSLLDDAHGDWDMARLVPPHIAKRYGYGDDPNPAKVTPAVTPDTKIATIPSVNAQMRVKRTR